MLYKKPVGIFLFLGIFASVFMVGKMHVRASTILPECGGMIVSEFIPNPVGNDTAGEWIEIYNQSEAAVDIEEYVISDSEGTPHKYTVGKVSISSHGFLIFDRKTTGITLNNDKESLILTRPDGTSCQTSFAVPDTTAKKGLEGQSFAYDEKGNAWSWTTTPTPGSTNVITEVPPEPDEEDESEGVLNNSCTGIMITEIMPSPDGSDGENEWIELYNSNGNTASLGGCVISDKLKSGSTKKYTIPVGTLIASGDYMHFMRPVTKITLNNDTDGAMILSSDGRVVFDSEVYSKPEEGWSFAYSDGGWFWTTMPTPGEANIISEPVPKETKKKTNTKAKKKATTKAPKSTKKTAKKSTGASQNEDGEVLGASTENQDVLKGKINDKTMGYILVVLSAILLVGYIVWVNKDLIHEHIIQKFSRK